MKEADIKGPTKELKMFLDSEKNKLGPEKIQSLFEKIYEVTGDVWKNQGLLSNLDDRRKNIEKQVQEQVAKITLK